MLLFCYFGKETILFLCHKISREKIKLNLRKKKERKQSNLSHIDEPGIIGMAYEFQNVVFTNELSNYSEFKV